MVKNLLANAGDSGDAKDAASLGQEDPLWQEMAARSSILAWGVLRTEELGGLQSMGLQRVGHY